MADAVFVGMFTRYVIELDDGSRLTVVRQNDAVPVEKGSKVNLRWRAEDAYEIDQTEGR